MRRHLFFVSLLFLFCSAPLQFAMGQIALVQDGSGVTCTTSTSSRDEPDRTIITQTIRCDDGTTRVCTITITSTNTSRTCSPSGAVGNIPGGCKIQNV